MKLHTQSITLMVVISISSIYTIITVIIIITGFSGWCANRRSRRICTCCRENHRASSISFSSTLMSVDMATARQPIMRLEGIGQGWQETYWTGPTFTPLSSSTSLLTASSIASPAGTWEGEHVWLCSICSSHCREINLCTQSHYDDSLLS